MELRYTVIDPTKNITLLVTTPVPRDVQPRVAAELLRREKDAEQVGFVEGLAAGDPRLARFREIFGQPIDRLLLIGGYAKPLPAEALDGAPAAARDLVPASEGAAAG